MQDQVGCIIGKDYPAPIVEHKTGVAQAKQRIYAVRKLADSKTEAQKIYQKHGSRKQPPNRKSRTPKKQQA